MSSQARPSAFSSRTYSTVFVVLMVLQLAISTTGWLRTRSMRNDGDMSADHRRQFKSQSEWVDREAAAEPLLLLAALLCMGLVARDRRKQATERDALEAELRRERSTLEQRIEDRTAELQCEVKERKRAERLNHGRNLLLEMLAREEPAQDIFAELTEVVANDRSSRGCALHLVGREGPLHLELEASSGMPHSLLRNLQEVTPSMLDAPEAIALAEKKPQVMLDLSRERRPWIQLLFANGIQSLWSIPFCGPDDVLLGTLTVYSLLRCTPTEEDIELLKGHSRMVSMVLERYRLQEELRRHAYHDSLTGLPNRLLGEEELGSAIRRSRRSRNPLAVFWIDLDNFKQMNDLHGHGAGDVILKEVARRLTGRLRNSDSIARMGGDEFMATVEDVKDRATAEKIAREVLEAIRQPIAYQEATLRFSASIGIAMFPEDGDSADILERNADMAMYEAKFGGHGVRMFSAALDHSQRERRELEVAMGHALEHGGFALYYQPQCDQTGRLIGFEALLRLPHPLLGMVSPGRLIPIAEESQMIVALGNWVLHEACTQSCRWQQQGYSPIRVAVNISAIQFAREDFADQVADVLRQTGLNPELLELELTESAVVLDFAESTRQLRRLQALGVRIAIDDFGTGYSSLNHLHRLPIHQLKMDRSFVASLFDNDGTRPIVEGIIAMAETMGLQVVGEGVETQEQLNLLSRKGCHLLQGFFFSPPVPADEAALMLETGFVPPSVRQELLTA